MNLNTLEDKVEYILDNVPDTRDNNELLVAYIRKCILRTKFNVKLSDFNAEQVPFCVLNISFLLLNPLQEQGARL